MPSRAVARHTAERMSGMTFTWIGAFFLSYVLGIDMGITNAVNTFLRELPNSRTQEREGTYCRIVAMQMTDHEYLRCS